MEIWYRLVIWVVRKLRPGTGVWLLEWGLGGKWKYVPNCGEFDSGVIFSPDDPGDGGRWIRIYSDKKWEAPTPPASRRHKPGP